MHAIQLIVHGRCDEAVKWLTLSENIARAKKEPMLVVKNDEGWMEEAKEACHPPAGGGSGPKASGGR